jgi:hypothetical protein
LQKGEQIRLFSAGDKNADTLQDAAYIASFEAVGRVSIFLPALDKPSPMYSVGVQESPSRSDGVALSIYVHRMVLRRINLINVISLVLVCLLILYDTSRRRITL